jgi:hypothetical protein
VLTGLYLGLWSKDGDQHPSRERAIGILAATQSSRVSVKKCWRRSAFAPSSILRRETCRGGTDARRSIQFARAQARVGGIFDNQRASTAVLDGTPGGARISASRSGCGALGDASGQNESHPAEILDCARFRVRNSRQIRGLRVPPARWPARL